jgi:hypothetical protein
MKKQARRIMRKVLAVAFAIFNVWGGPRHLQIW